MRPSYIFSEAEILSEENRYQEAFDLLTQALGQKRR